MRCEVCEDGFYPNCPCCEEDIEEGYCRCGRKLTYLDEQECPVCSNPGPDRLEEVE